MVIDKLAGNFNPVIIDFGKACFETDGKTYTLSSAETSIYKNHHPHIAPDVTDDTSKQSQQSDVYSLGRVLHSINKKSTIPAMESLMNMCLQYHFRDRPTTSKICTFLESLSS